MLLVLDATPTKCRRIFTCMIPQLLISRSQKGHGLMIDLRRVLHTTRAWVTHGQECSSANCETKRS